MKKEQLARRLARESNINPGTAADQLDQIVSDILERVRKGESARFPGLGTFRPIRQTVKLDREPPVRLGRAQAKKGSL